MRVRVKAAQVLDERQRQQLVCALEIAGLAQLDSLDSQVVVGIGVGKRSPRDAVELVRLARLRGEPLPERGVRIARVVVVLVDLTEILDVRPFERQWFEPEAR